MVGKGGVGAAEHPLAQRTGVGAVGRNGEARGTARNRHVGTPTQHVGRLRGLPPTPRAAWRVANVPHLFKRLSLGMVRGFKEEILGIL